MLALPSRNGLLLARTALSLIPCRRAGDAMDSPSAKRFFLSFFFFFSSPLNIFLLDKERLGIGTAVCFGTEKVFLCIIEQMRVYVCSSCEKKGKGEREVFLIS